MNRDTRDSDNPSYLSRRRILSASAGALVGLAGCASDSENVNNGSTATVTTEDQPRETTEITETQTSTPEPSAEVIDSEVFEAPFFSDGAGDDVPWLRVDVQNSTETLHRDVSVETRFRDQNNEILATREQSTAVLPAGATWRYYSKHDFDMEEFNRAEQTITEQEVGTRGNFIENFEILNASMDFDNSSGIVSLTGEIELNNSEIEDIVIASLIYDEEDQFRGAFRIRGENNQETVAFDGGLAGFGTPYDRPRPDDFEVILAEPLL